jgi:hypothetical protein
MEEHGMGLVVSGEVVRDLIADGEYSVESIEQREHGRVAVRLLLRTHAQPYSIQIETSDNRLEGFFRALLNGKGSTIGQNPAVKVGGQPTPVIEADAMPVDRPKRLRRPTKVAIQPGPALSGEKPPRAKRRRSAAGLYDGLDMGSASHSLMTWAVVPGAFFFPLFFEIAKDCIGRDNLLPSDSKISLSIKPAA